MNCSEILTNVYGHSNKTHLPDEEYERKCASLVAHLRLRPGRTADELRVIVAESKPITLKMLEHLADRGLLISRQEKFGKYNGRKVTDVIGDRWYPTGLQQTKPARYRPIPEPQWQKAEALPVTPPKPDPKSIKPLSYGHSKQVAAAANPSPELRTEPAPAKPRTPRSQKPRGEGRPLGEAELRRIQDLILKAIAAQTFDQSSYGLYRSLKPGKHNVQIARFNKALNALEADGKISSFFNSQGLCVWRLATDDHPSA